MRAHGRGLILISQELQASLPDQFSCKYFFCQIKIERTRASDVTYVFHFSHRFFIFILGHLVKRICIYSFKNESLPISLTPSFYTCVHFCVNCTTEQAGDELCQAQVKLVWPDSSVSLRFSIFISLKICTYTLIKD